MSSETSRRIPSLDGIRAVSISLVLIGHLAGGQGFLSQRLLEPFGDLGNLGVRVFFVISGFLITTLLLAELQNTGNISLPWFYFRRTLRIFPAAYAFVFAMWLASLWGWVQLNGGDIVHAITYTMNYSPGRSWSVGHLWSLSLEEQFYLIWPATLWIAGRTGGMRIAAAVCLCCPFIRLGIWYFVPDLRSLIGNAFFTDSDSVATGCLLAGMRYDLEHNRFYRKLLDSYFVPALPVLIILVNAILFGRARLIYSVGDTVLNVSIALFIHWAVLSPKSYGGRFLNSRPLVFVGVLSYSMYLWQQPFLNREASGTFHTFPINLAALTVAALASYYLVESPLLRLRSTIEARLRMQPVTVSKGAN